MLDSVLIKILDFNILDDKYFINGKMKTVAHGRKILFPVATKICSLAKVKRKQNIYFPQIHIEKRIKTSEELCVQVSIPKLLFGTNLYDCDQSRLSEFTIAVRSALLEAGVEVSYDAIVNSVVARIDFSKIINLTGHCTTDKCLNILKNFNYKPMHEFTEKEYNANGKMLKYYSKAQSLKFYDKIAELVDNGFTATEMELKDKLLKSTTVIIKIENSLQMKQTVSRILNAFFKQNKTDWHLKDIFNNELAKSVLNKQFDSVFGTSTGKLIKLGLLDKKDLELSLNRSVKNPTKRLEILGCLEMIKAKGLVVFLKELKVNTKPATYYRLKNKLTSLVNKFILPPSPDLNIIDLIKEQLTKFELLTPHKSITKTSTPKTITM